MISDSLMNKEFTLEDMNKEELRNLANEMLNMDVDNLYEITFTLFNEYYYECNMPAVKVTNKNIEDVHQLLYLFGCNKELKRRLKTEVLRKVQEYGTLDY